MVQKGIDRILLLFIMVGIGFAVGSYWMVGLCLK
jgi:hypothetical protein